MAGASIISCYQELASSVSVLGDDGALHSPEPVHHALSTWQAKRTNVGTAVTYSGGKDETVGGGVAFVWFQKCLKWRVGKGDASKNGDRLEEC